MPSRRKFLTQASLSTMAALGGVSNLSCANPQENKSSIPSNNDKPIVISTWDFGLKANETAMKVLAGGGSALDAVEQGVRVIEADGKNSSVGYGGLPDRDGRVTLDACIMGPNGRCGSVCSIEHIMHPVTVARKVMEKTPHVILVGDGALEFALSQGMEKVDLLTAKARKAWEEWKVESKYKPIINIENHDTIGMLSMDINGDLAGACTTSGLSFKMRGRVGDSPIIGAGLYVDNEVGAATATGLGEAVLRSLSTFLIVELMRQGKSPENACMEAIDRIVKKHKEYEDFQVGLIAMNKDGETGGYSIHKGFNYAKTSKIENGLVKCHYFTERK